MMPTHIQRDCVYRNKARAEICSEIFMNPKLKKIIMKIHHAKAIQQLNTVPVNSVCSIDKIKIPLATGGIQINISRWKQIEHICIQKIPKTLLLLLN